MSDRNIKSANTPVTYKTTLDVSAFEKVKLEQTFDDGSHKKVSFPIFTGDGSKTGNTEALIHCLDQYIRHTSKDLQWEDQERFDNLEDVLTGEAFAYWTEEVVPRYENTPVPRFDPAIALFIQRFSGGDRGRDRLIRYLQGVNVRKDVEVSVQEHFGRLIHMMNISDRLSGIEFPPLTQVQRARGFSLSHSHISGELTSIIQAWTTLPCPQSKLRTTLHYSKKCQQAIATQAIATQATARKTAMQVILHTIQVKAKLVISTPMLNASILGENAFSTSMGLTTKGPSIIITGAVIPMMPTTIKSTNNREWAMQAQSISLMAKLMSLKIESVRLLQAVIVFGTPHLMMCTLTILYRSRLSSTVIH